MYGVKPYTLLHFFKTMILVYGFMNKWLCFEYIFLKLSIYFGLKMKNLFLKSGRYKRKAL